MRVWQPRAGGCPLESPPRTTSSNFTKMVQKGQFWFAYLLSRQRGTGVSTIPPLFLPHPPCAAALHGDVSLAPEGDWRMIVRKGKVENGNSG